MLYSDVTIPKGNTRPYTAINMVSSVDGKISIGGKLPPNTLGSRYDRQVMNYIRLHFDGVLCGGATFREHPYFLGVPPELEQERVQRGLTPQPRTIILTNQGNLPTLTNPPHPPIIISTSCDTQGEYAKNLDCAVILLYEKYGITRLLVEGGPTVNYQFFASKLVDELFLTLAPKIVGTQDPTIVTGLGLPELTELELLEIHRNNSELFLRYRVKVRK